MSEVRQIVDEQAEDDGLWFIAQTAPEAYLQAALRRLHAAVESAPSEPSAIADAARVLAWARDPQRKPAAEAFTAGPERQAAYWIEWAWSEPAEIRREALREAVRICEGVRADRTKSALRWKRFDGIGLQLQAMAEGADACAEAITAEVNASLPAQPSEGY